MTPEDDTRKSKLYLDFILLVRTNPFRGSALEHPHKHVEYLEDLVSDDYNRCTLFSFSLEGKARKWINQIPAGSLTCWEEIRNAFINQFFDDARYWDIREKLSYFSQGPRESFKNAWVRFENYQLDCIHHGYSEPQLLTFFYNGISLRYQIMLDTASEGNFGTRNPTEARRLIKNIALGKSYEISDREERATTRDTFQLAEIRQSLDYMHSLVRETKIGRSPPDRNGCSKKQLYSVEKGKTQNCNPDEESFTRSYDALIKSHQKRPSLC